MIMETPGYQVFIDGLLVCKTLLQSGAGYFIFVLQLVVIIEKKRVLLINLTQRRL